MNDTFTQRDAPNELASPPACEPVSPSLVDHMHTMTLDAMFAGALALAAERVAP